MIGWMEAKAAGFETKVEAGQTKRTLGIETVRQLEMLVSRDIEEWNSLNPGYRRKIDGMFNSLSSGSFQVQKTSFPPASVRTFLSPDSSSIKLECTKIDLGATATYTIEDRFDLLPAANNTTCEITHDGASISLGEASRILLEPILENMK